MSMMDKAAVAWGKILPDWVRALAEACDQSSLRKVAARLEVSPAIVSLAVGRKREILDFIKGKVEAVLMITMVVCPVLGVMGKNECLREQAAEFTDANPLRIQLYRACRSGCPHRATVSHKEKVC